MTERRRGQQPIDLDVAEESRKRALEQLGALRTLVEDKFGGPATMQLLGILTFGEKQKTIIGPDGKPTKVDWTFEDIHSGWNEVGLASERDRRNGIVEEVEVGLTAQEEFFRKSRSRIREAALDRVRFARVLIERYQARELTVPDRYSKPDDPELEHEEKVLVSLAEITLPKAPLLYVGSPLEEDQVRRLLKNRRLRDWAKVTKAQGNLLKEYLDGLSVRVVQVASSNVDILRRLVRGGKRVYSNKQLSPEIAFEEKAKKIATGISQIPDFDGVLPWIKEHYGSDADYTILSPRPHEQTQNSSS